MDLRPIVAVEPETKNAAEAYFSASTGPAGQATGAGEREQTETDIDQARRWDL